MWIFIFLPSIFPQCWVARASSSLGDRNQGRSRKGAEQKLLITLNLIEFSLLLAAVRVNLNCSHRLSGMARWMNELEIETTSNSILSAEHASTAKGQVTSSSFCNLQLQRELSPRIGITTCFAVNSIAIHNLLKIKLRLNMVGCLPFNCSTTQCIHSSIKMRELWFTGKN